MRQFVFGMVLVILSYLILLLTHSLTLIYIADHSGFDSLWREHIETSAIASCLSIGMLITGLLFIGSAITKNQK